MFMKDTVVVLLKKCTISPLNYTNTQYTYQLRDKLDDIFVNFLEKYLLM